MRVSISTKVFLGFVAVLVSFGLSSMYNLYRTGQLRENMAFMREGVLPLEKDLIHVEESLRSYYKDVLAHNRRPRALEKLRYQLPKLHPKLFETLDKKIFISSIEDG